MRGFACEKCGTEMGFIDSKTGLCIGCRGMLNESAATPKPQPSRILPAVVSGEAERVGRVIQQLRESKTATPIGYVEATVRIPVYAGDDLDGSWDWFEYAQPGLTPGGEVGVCKRPVQLIDAKVVKARTHEEDKR